MTDDRDPPQQPPQRGSQYGNFKPEPGAKKLSSGKRRPGNDPAYLALIRQLPCCIPGCTRGPSDPHHLKGSAAAGPGERVAFRRATDKWAVPICRFHHDIVQSVRGDVELSLFEDYGIDNIYDLARALWTAVRDLGIMRRLVRDHQEP